MVVLGIILKRNFFYTKFISMIKRFNLLKVWVSFYFLLIQILIEKKNQVKHIYSIFFFTMDRNQHPDNN